jgi:hypothetical protein
MKDIKMSVNENEFQIFLNTLDTADYDALVDNLPDYFFEDSELLSYCDVGEVDQMDYWIDDDGHERFEKRRYE